MSQQKKRRNYLVPEPNYHTTKFFTENLLPLEIKKRQIDLNKPVYLGLPILELSKILIYEFWYDYDIECTKADDIYKDIAEDVETRFDTSNDELDRPLAKGKNKKVIGLMKDELGGKIMIKFVGLRAKTYSYFIDYGSEDKKAKGTKKCAIKKT